MRDRKGEREIAVIHNHVQYKPDPLPSQLGHSATEAGIQAFAMSSPQMSFFSSFQGRLRQPALWLAPISGVILGDKPIRA